jgi:formylmethanofuran dehydrogenase subunit D
MKNEKEEKDEEYAIEMKVVPSRISSVDSGIARINEMHLKELGNEEHHLIRIRSEKTTITSKLFGDKLVPEGQIVLREGDMEDLGVNNGDEVELLPYTTIKEDISTSWQNFKQKIRDTIKDKMEEEE